MEENIVIVLFLFLLSEAIKAVTLRDLAGLPTVSDRKADLCYCVTLAGWKPVCRIGQERDDLQRTLLELTQRHKNAQMELVKANLQGRSRFLHYLSIFILQT
jgi:hypothetical protein